MRISTSMRWLVVVAGAIMLLAVAAACSSETIEVPGETVVVKEEVIKTVEVPGETVVKEVIKEVQVPGETVVVKEEVVKEVMVPGETVVVEKEVVKTVEVPGETVTVEVVKTVEVPGQTVVVEKVVEKEVIKTVAGPERVVVREVPGGKTYVTDPTTGKVGEAPRYGGTLTYPTIVEREGSDAVVWGGSGVFLLQGVLEKPAIANWALSKDEWGLSMITSNTPLWTLTGLLAESWETPDDTTIILHVRKSARWHDKAPMNGREFTADDMVFNYQRYLALGEFADAEPAAAGDLNKVFIESVTATDKYTVVFKLERPSFTALKAILQWYSLFMHPPEVVEQYGNTNDWRTLVGTGPFMLTDYVEGSSVTWIKNPDYYGFDEKYPENRLPYVDQVTALLMKEEATRMAALRTGKVDYRGYAGETQLRTVDLAISLARTNPEIAQWPFLTRSDVSFGVNVSNPPFNDIRVRKAMQMAKDLETINDTYYGGRAVTTPQGFVGFSQKGWFIPFDEWPEEVKKGYTYDKAGAEALLDEAGYPRGADGIRFKTSVLLRPIAEMGYYELAASYWREIGVDVEIQVTSGYPEWAATRAECTFGLLGMFMGAHYWGEFLVSGWRTGGTGYNNSCVSGDPKVDAMIDALQATTDFEEYQRLFREIDMYSIEQHWMIWSPAIPMTITSQPWLKGYNGEAVMGNWQFFDLFARVWIDQELKEAMGH